MVQAAAFPICIRVKTSCNIAWTATIVIFSVDFPSHCRGFLGSALKQKCASSTTPTYTTILVFLEAN